MLYFPVVIGPITVSYNLSGLSKPLKLDATTIASIFEAKITTWNNSAIAADNPGVSLPSTAITICRPLGFLGYHPELLRVPGQGRAERLDARLQLDHQVARHQPRRQRQRRGRVLHQEHPRGRRVRGLRRRQGLRLTFASVKNSAGSYVAPSPASATAAADSATLASNLTFSAIWASGAQAYPITYQSWVLVYETQPNANDAAMLKAYIGYLVGAGQQLLPSLGYAPLPSGLDSMATGAAQQDNQLGVSTVMVRQDQIGSLL